MRWKTAIAALLGVSAYQAAPSDLPSLDSPHVEEARKVFGGQLAHRATSRTRWYLADLESATHAADNGHMGPAAQLMRSARTDGVHAGVLSTRTGGLVRLPKKFKGRQEIIDALEAGHTTVRSVFDEMFPPAELEALAADGDTLGVGVAELVPVPGRDYPVMVRLDPEFLVYRWSENRWYYRSIAGELPITPGDGRWILHCPGGRTAPWNNGLWKALGRAYIRKEHASLHKDNWEAKLANPARVAVAPQGATESQKQSWFRRVMAWGINTVFGMTPGYDVKLLESNGRGYESFDSTIDRQDREVMICIAGQVVTTDGGAGFSNADIHKTIRADLIKKTADALAYTINTQGLPGWVVSRWGEDALNDMAVVEWDVTPPKDRASEANASTAVATAIERLQEVLRANGRELDVDAMVERYGVPVRPPEELEEELEELELEPVEEDDGDQGLRIVEEAA